MLVNNKAEPGLKLPEPVEWNIRSQVLSKIGLDYIDIGILCYEVHEGHEVFFHQLHNLHGDYFTFPQTK